MSQIRILPYRPELQPFFESINKEWVEELFSLEEFDRMQLENPQETIIDKGGAILFAEMDGEIVGTVGLSKVKGQTYELIKMGVRKSAQGKGIGMILGKAILEKAWDMGAEKVELYSHSKLGPALKIYQKLGFEAEKPEEGKYARCDVKMFLKKPHSLA
ncbi:GNAT family N-acetyltransferase [Algoriphagus limi]|uniref:GNAT family N-acetyltransferase n=1 Tax=Algoriphagus limi TaxID=2975273 RepID=A0ABT2G4T7_9BACT|nr:GNAT family N-acetyltransferase [Algoriphagus limi]MCS5489788.1 GNAT family N-acetyltransferase [Algoriphagus limi]